MILLSSGGFDNAVLETMLANAKKKYVDSRHSQAIFQMRSTNKYKDGNWKTYITQEGKRKEVIRKTEEELYKALFSFYRSLEDAPKTFADVVEILLQKKETELNRSSNTIYDDRRYYAYISESIQRKPLNEITESDLRKWLQNEYLPTMPKEAALRKMLQHLKKLFRFGMSLKLCTNNPAEYIEYEDYAIGCDLHKKSDEEREFSKEELSKIQADALKTPLNPRALMTLFAKETGMRAGEMPVLHTSDIDKESGFIHVHRQQLRGKKDGHQYFYEVGYTKDERTHPSGGRYVPITAACTEILRIAEQLPGTSEYLFHDKEGNWITKDSYEQNLRRRCTQLGITTKNNHAFRLAFNSYLIGLGFNSAERASILGHSVETNERHYSVSDNRQRFELRDRLLAAKK